MYTSDKTNQVIFFLKLEKYFLGVIWIYTKKRRRGRRNVTWVKNVYTHEIENGVEILGEDTAKV